MESYIYEDIICTINALNSAHVNDRIFSELCNKYSSICEETLLSIIALWNQRKITKTSFKVKDVDIYSLYKKLRSSGISMACQQMSRQLQYPPSLIAKIVISSFLSETKVKNEMKVQEIRNLRKVQCARCQKTNNQIEETNITTEVLMDCAAAASIKKHNDPRVELALNLFDETDDIGKYFLEKFSPQNQSNSMFGRDYFFANDNSSRSSLNGTTPVSHSNNNSALMNSLKTMKMDDTSDRIQNDDSLVSDAVSENIIGMNNTPYSSVSDAREEFHTKTFDSTVCTCDSHSESDSSCSDSEESDDENNYSVRDLLENTSLIDDPVLAQDVFVCTLSDDQYGPTSDAFANSSGVTYELLLEKLVQEMGLSFKTENKLRGVGVDKTPDIILQVPVAVDNFIINWIESKALFADKKLHQELKRNQYKNYLNRFGPGLVIYWRGYVDDIPDLYLLENKQLLIRDAFPSKDSFTFMNLNKFRSWMKSNDGKNFQ